MPGKLPIDRVRANEDATAIYKLEKERLTRYRARRRVRRAPSGLAEAGPLGSASVHAAEGDNESQALEQETEDA